jgi:hypothetical protein
VIVAPGEKIAGPTHGELGILYAEIDLERVGMAQPGHDAWVVGGI